jgi:hypothetical protein
VELSPPFGGSGIQPGVLIEGIAVGGARKLRTDPLDWVENKKAPRSFDRGPFSTTFDKTSRVE